MERRRERFMIINTWQQIEDPEKNILGFEINERARHTTIKDTRIKWNKKSKNSTLIYKSLIIFLAGLLYINVEFLLFLFHFILVSFIVLCLSLLFVSNPNKFFSGSSICCHVLIIMYLSLLFSMLYKL